MKPNGRIKEVIKKEMIEIRRSGLLKFLIAAPIIQALIFGFVATTDIKHVPAVICDADRTAESRSLGDMFRHSEYFDVVKYTADEKDIDRLFNTNKAIAAVNIPAGFSDSIKRGERAAVQLIVDGSDSNSSLVSMNRAAAMIGGYSQKIFGEKLEIIKKTVGELPSVKMEERVWFNPELKSANVMVPGVIGLILVIVTLVITALSIVREKENGNIEQLIVTPVKPAEIITGKIIPYTVIALIDIVLITAVSLLVFQTGFEGSFLLLLTLSLFMIFANLGLGIYVSTVSSTQQQAMLTSIFLLLPNILLSGFVFPIKNMPEILQAVTYVIPMRYYMVILRGIFLKGAGFAELWPQVLALAVFGFVIFVMAVKRFRKVVQ